MAYARLAGLEPVRGLWAALGALILYALLGTSSQLSVGPESASALLVSTSIATIGFGLPPSVRPQIAMALALGVGVIFVVAWATRLGFVADLLSRPVLVGYMSGVAVAMIVSQLPNITGIATRHHDTVPVAFDVLHHLGGLKLGPLILAGMVVVGLVLLQRFRRLPGPLLVVVFAAAATGLLDLQRHGVTTVGHLKSGTNTLQLSGIPAHTWPLIFVAAAGIAVVVFSDDVVTARAFAMRNGDHIDVNQEFLALAGANTAAAVVGGFPVSSSGSRTAIVESAGGRSQLSSVVAGVAVLSVLAFGGSLLESIPLAALGGLVVYAAVRLVNVGEIRRIARFRKSEMVIVAAAAIGVVLFGVLVGIAIAIGLSVAELFARIARAHDAVQGAVPGLAGLHDVDDYPEAKTIPGLVVYRYDAPLCFANAGDFHSRVIAAVEQEPDPVDWVLLNLEANVEIDLTASDMLEALRTDLEARGIVLALARVKRDLALYLDRTGFMDRVGRERIFPTLPTAIEAFQQRREAGGLLR